MAPAVADLKAMTDAFEGIDKLAEGAPRTDGAPNFRRVNTETNTKEGPQPSTTDKMDFNKPIKCDILVSEVQVLEIN